MPYARQVQTAPREQPGRPEVDQGQRGVTVGQTLVSDQPPPLPAATSRRSPASSRRRVSFAISSFFTILIFFTILPFMKSMLR